MKKAAALVAAVIGALCLSGAAAQSLKTELVPTPQVESKAPPAAPVITPQGTPELTAADVNAWLDGFMSYSLAKDDIAGAVVVVVKDGQILTQKGYGYADVAKRKPVDPANTLFRPGSVSKLFTWTAVMQLVEQGKLNLDQDVNSYIDFKIPPYNGKPITLRNILTHTAGFEEVIKDLILEDPKGLMTLEKYVKTHLPERVFAPGTTPAYSNYATALAGYIVERRSGESFDDYIDHHIFTPLGMTKSSFRQPLPPRLAGLMSTGYKRASGDPQKFEIVVPAPAGSLSSPGTDMAYFMIAHLQNGEFQGKRILSAATAEQMHNTPLTLLPPLNRMELGFFETNINGREVIAHLGDSQYFHTSLHLMLKENVGFYVSYNSSGREGAAGTQRLALFEDFADRYFPGPPVTSRVPAKIAAEHAKLMAGSWESSRRGETNFINAIGLLGGQTKVGVSPKGDLSIPSLTGYNGAPRKWVEIAPFVWREVGGHEMIAAKVENGKVVRWSFGLVAPFTVYDRAPWYKNTAWLMPLVYGSLAAMLLTVLLWPTGWFVRRRFASPLQLERKELRAHRLVRLADLATLLVLVGWAVFVTVMLGNLDNASSAGPWIWLLQIASLLVFVGGFLVALWNLWVVWTGKRRWTTKVWSIVLAIASLTVLWIALAFHLIDFGTNF
jgi:CubicO group peptidase (beta-lactamase class C family)